MLSMFDFESLPLPEIQLYKKMFSGIQHILESLQINIGQQISYTTVELKIVPWLIFDGNIDE